MKKIKRFFNEESKFNIKDLFVLAIIIIFYTILSFINLGTNISPQTYYDINALGIKITLEKKEFVNQIVFYSGENSGDYNFESFCRCGNQRLPQPTTFVFSINISFSPFSHVKKNKKCHRIT